MTTKPIGVFQNDAPPYAPIHRIEIAEANWSWFSNQADADRGFDMIDALCDNATMVYAETLGGMYSQYIYTPPAKALTIHCRIVNATTRDAEGVLNISEYPSDIVDRDTTPLPFIDEYTVGQPHVLAVQRATSEGPRSRGQLYWKAA